jgi:hypothetical protein
VATAADDRRVLRRLWWIAGLVLIAGGVAIALVSRPEAVDARWFVYTPMSDAPDGWRGWDEPQLGTSAWILSPWQVAGCVLAVLGLLAVARGVGFRMGRRRAEV